MNGIYQIECQNCDALYIEQSGRPFRTRIKEHLNAINKQIPTTGFAEHIIETKHLFNGKFKILHIEEKGLRLNCLENLEIRKAVNSQKNIVNEQLEVTDSPLLNINTSKPTMYISVSSPHTL